MNKILDTKRVLDRTSPAHILIVDDDVVSVMAIRRTLKRLKISNSIAVATDGQEALDMLRSYVTDDILHPPVLVTLDLNMPRMGGIEFLEKVEADPSLRNTMIFVLSTSDTSTDMDKAFERNIAGYLFKDGMQESFEQALGYIDASLQLTYTN